MKLAEISHKSTLELLMYLERFVCQKFHHAYANYSEVSKQFQPQNVYTPFLLPLVDKNNWKISIFGENEILKSILNIGFPIHPDTIADLFGLKFKIINNLSVLPTCSTRTLFTDFNNSSIFLKTHIDRYISRIRRKVKPEDVEIAIYISNIIKKQIINDKAPKDFGFLLDTGGAILSTGEKNIGVIIRDTRPFPELSDGRYLIPIFSLYSKDKNQVNDQPLLIQLINQSGEDPVDYVIKNIAIPAMTHFNYFAYELDIVLQPHAQNTLLELDKNFSVLRIIHRDIPTRQIDYKLIKQEKWPSDVNYSIMYDNYLCKDSLQLLGNVLVDYFKIDRQYFISAIKSCFSEIMAIKDRFPKEEYSLPEKLMERSEPIILNTQPAYR